MIRRVLMLMLVALALPSAAQAATVTLDGGVLRYVGTPGKVTNLTITQSGTSVTITRVTATDTDPLATNPACSPSTDATITCSSITSLDLDVGDMSDRVTANTVLNGPNVLIPMTVTGGD